jgi:hypothetical protein
MVGTERAKLSRRYNIPKVYQPRALMLFLNPSSSIKPPSASEKPVEGSGVKIVTELIVRPVPTRMPPGLWPHPMNKIGVGDDGHVRKPVPIVISIIPSIVPESMEVKSTVVPS